MVSSPRQRGDPVSPGHVDHAVPVPVATGAPAGKRRVDTITLNGSRHGPPFTFERKIADNSKRFTVRIRRTRRYAVRRFVECTLQNVYNRQV